MTRFSLWYVACSLPFSKRKMCKRKEKELFWKKSYISSASHSPLSDRRFNLSTYQHLAIADWWQCLSWRGKTHFSVWYVACSLPFSKERYIKEIKKRALLKKSFSFLPIQACRPSCVCSDRMNRELQTRARSNGYSCMVSVEGNHLMNERMP